MLELFLILATWRVTSLFAQEHGPYKLFIKIRKIVKLDCFWCWSVWVGFFFAVAWQNDIKSIVLYTLAYSAGAIIIEQVLIKLRRDDIQISNR